MCGFEYIFYKFLVSFGGALNGQFNNMSPVTRSLRLDVKVYELTELIRRRVSIAHGSGWQ